MLFLDNLVHFLLSKIVFKKLISCQESKFPLSKKNIYLYCLHLSTIQSFKGPMFVATQLAWKLWKTWFWLILWLSVIWALCSCSKAHGEIHWLSRKIFPWISLIFPDSRNPVHSVSKETHHEFIGFPCDLGSRSSDPGRVIFDHWYQEHIDTKSRKYTMKFIYLHSSPK